MLWKRARTDAPMDVVPTSSRSAPFSTAPSDSLRDTAQEVYGVEPVVRPRTAGTGPMFLFHRIGLTATVDGVGIGHHGSLVHAPNENVYVDDYYRGIEHVIRILDRFART